MSDHLEVDRRRYRSLRDSAFNAHEAGDLERALEYSAVAAALAWHGRVRWYDDDLESLLESIGGRCIDGGNLSIATPDDDDLRITHLATFLADHGGHSETLRMWTKMLDSRDTVAEQHLVLTNQHNDRSRFPSLESELTERAVSIDQLAPDATYVERIRTLATVLTERPPDRLVLFINPDDVVAVSALYGLDARPTTVFFNHADHVFWLGRGVIDELVEYRSVGRTISDRFRDLQSRCVVPLTTDIELSEAVSPLLSPDAETVTASIATRYKVQPSLGHNYFATVGRLLERNPDHVHVLVTTGSCENLLDEYVSPAVRDRFLVRGPLADLRPVYRMADVLLDSIPYSGGLARLEALACGVPLVAFDVPELSFLPNVDVFTDEYPYIASSTDEYVRHVEKLLSDAATRDKTGGWMRERFVDCFSPDSVGERLSTLLVDDEPLPGWTGRESNADTFDPETYARLFRTPAQVNKRLLMCALKKESPRGVVDRLELYSGAVANREFDTVEEWVGYFGLCILGRRAYPAALALRDAMTRVRPR